MIVSAVSGGAILASATRPPLVVGFIGDSITEGADASNVGVNDAVTLCGAALATNWGARSVTVLNRGVAGSDTNSWDPQRAADYYDAAAAAMIAAGVNLIHGMLGTNDSKTSGQFSASFFQSNWTDILAQLAIDFPSIPVLLSYSPYIDYTNGGASLWDSSSDTALVAYQAKIDGFVNNVQVWQGDKTAYPHFQSNTGQLVDGVHPNDTGHAFLGAAWAAAIHAAGF